MLTQSRHRDISSTFNFCKNAKTIFLNLLQALDCSAALVHHDHTPALVSLFNVCILHLYLYYYLYLHLYLHL